ncbi:acetolactate synthase small subunit [Streptomyces liangshanensis]|uniref:Acetolactate synthase small subunit n=1 Tax=Streptomyces liangshanensis TaxID=2717324 RepID=A0A6G9GT18_9ACTN|nr:acetolactate synthase small subunit [Streptomyces liangshanensis]
MSQHTLSVLVENTPGILARVAGLFSRRGFDIDSLAVGTTEHPGLSRVTLVVRVDERLPLEQVTKQLNKLVNVVKIVELEADSAVRRELVLVKVAADNTTRGQIVQIAELFRAGVVDVSPEAVVLEATGSGDKLDGMLRMLAPFGIKELVQSGAIAIGRGPRALADRTVREARPMRLTPATAGSTTAASAVTAATARSA